MPPRKTVREGVVVGWSVMTCDRPLDASCTYGAGTAKQVARDAFILVGRLEPEGYRHPAVSMTPGEADALAALLTEAAVQARAYIVAREADLAEQAQRKT